MRYIYLVGAAKTGKTAVAKKLASTIPKSRIVDLPTTSQLKQLNFPVGNLIDHRVEVYLASQRAIESFSTFPKNADIEWLIVVNSPLTNLAYTAAITDNIEEVPEDEEEQWRILTTLSYLWVLAQDSVWNDNFFFLPGNDGTSFGESVETNLKTILTNLELPYYTLEGKTLQQYEKAAKILANA